MQKLKLASASAAVALLTAACGGAGGISQSEGKDVLKIGTVPVVSVAPIHLGMKKGFFSDQNIQIELTTAQGGPALISGVMGGSLNIGISATTPLIQARAASLPVVALDVARLTTEPGVRGTSALVVPQNSTVDDITDLAGKKIAVNGVKSINDLLIREVMAQAGGDPSSLKFIEIPFPSMPSALQMGRADAVAVAEPFLSTLLQEGARPVSFYSKEVKGPKAPTVWWFTNSRQLEANSDVFKRFLVAFNKSTKYAQSHPKEVRDILLTYTDLTKEQAAEVQLPYLHGEPALKWFRNTADLMVKHGFIKSAPDNLSGIVAKPAAS